MMKWFVFLLFFSYESLLSAWGTEFMEYFNSVITSSGCFSLKNEEIAEEGKYGHMEQYFKSKHFSNRHIFNKIDRRLNQSGFCTSGSLISFNSDAKVERLATECIRGLIKGMDPSSKDMHAASSKATITIKTQNARKDPIGNAWKFYVDGIEFYTVDQNGNDWKDGIITIRFERLTAEKETLYKGWKLLNISFR